MSNAKDEVMKMIAKKQKRNTSFRNRSAKRTNIHSIVVEFIKAMEKVLTESKSHLDFDTGMNREATMLEQRMRSLDPGVKLQVLWNNENATENWQELQVEGIKIMWSGFYLGKHPFESPEKYIDVGSLFIEGYLD